MGSPSLWQVLTWVLGGMVGSLLVQLLWHRKAAAEWCREEYRYRRGGLLVWWAMRKERPRRRIDLDVLVPTVLALAGAAGLAWAVWGQW